MLTSFLYHCLDNSVLVYKFVNGECYFWNATYNAEKTFKTLFPQNSGPKCQKILIN